jgi:hypothetical protein
MIPGSGFDKRVGIVKNLSYSVLLDQFDWPRKLQAMEPTHSQVCDGSRLQKISRRVVTSLVVIGGWRNFGCAGSGFRTEGGDPGEKVVKSVSH